jgi:hypothetical protein
MIGIWFLILLLFPPVAFAQVVIDTGGVISDVVEVLPKADYTGQVAIPEQAVASDQAWFVVKTDIVPVGTQLFINLEESLDGGKTWRFLCGAVVDSALGTIPGILSCPLAKADRLIRGDIIAKENTGKKTQSGAPDATKEVDTTINTKIEVVTVK